MEYLNKVINQAVITLGGKGTRLKEITNDVPKPLWRIEGCSTLHWAMKILVREGIENFIWITNFQHNLFLNEAKFLEDFYKIKILIHQEVEEKGEAGSLLDIFKKLDDQFLFLNGDIIFDLDISRLFKFHMVNNSDITFVTHLTTHPEDSDCIIENKNLSIYKYKLKNENRNTNGFYLGNAGLSIITKRVVKEVIMGHKNKKKELSLFNDFVIFSHKKNFNVFSYNTSEYLKDMGTPDRLKKVSKDIKNGEVARYSYRYKQRAIFVDRDNTLNQCLEGEYIVDINQINLFEQRIKNISKLATKFDLVVLITNQPQISMGKVSWQKVIEINGEIISRCQSLGLNISSFYLCPHHEISGFKDEIISLKSSCFCRKPQPGLFLEAAFKRNIDLNKSIMIGDSWRDKKASEEINLKFIDAATFD